MPNPQLTKEQRETLFKPLFQTVVTALEQAAAADADVLWALRRKLAKELTYLERGSTRSRMLLKAAKMASQNRLCAICKQELPAKGAELDRYEAMKGYTPENTRLVHHDCHVADQARKGFK